MTAQKTRKKKSGEKESGRKERGQGDGLVRVQLVKSLIGVPEKVKRVAIALGLRKTNSVVVKENNPAIMGMIFKVRHLVKTERVAK
jgi:large subunit ribosomal protein L30